MSTTDKWSIETMAMINKLTPDIKGKSFDPDWFLLRERLDKAGAIIDKINSNAVTQWVKKRQLREDVRRLNEQNTSLLSQRNELREALEFMLRVGPSGIIGQQTARERALKAILNAKCWQARTGI